MYEKILSSSQQSNNSDEDNVSGENDTSCLFNLNYQTNKQRNNTIHPTIFRKHT
jgi:hypothetical protein